MVNYRQIYQNIVYRNVTFLNKILKTVTITVTVTVTVSFNKLIISKKI